MDQEIHHPSHCHTDSFPGFQPWNTRDFDVKKKRKLLIDPLGLPTPKLPCWGSKSIRFPYRNNLNLNKIPQEEEEDDDDEEEEERNLTKMAIDEVNEKSKEEVRMQSKKDGNKDELHRRYYGHEEDLLEFGSHENCRIDEQCFSDRAQSLLLPKDNKQDFVLSSGRWNIDPEAESKTVKPTIDQEFEQYFSVLMPFLDP